MSKSNTTDTSTLTTLPEYPERRERPPKHQKNVINEWKMAWIEAKVVDEIPWDSDGLCKFILKCAPEELQKMTRDGHWFLMDTSGKSTSSYVQKVGHCLGSFVCYNLICSKRLTENVINQIDFKH